jgi:hypothetical protein
MQFYLAFMLTVGLKKFAPTGVCAISPIASVSRARIGSRSLRLAEAAFTVGHSPRVTGAKPSSPMPSTTCLDDVPVVSSPSSQGHCCRTGAIASRITTVAFTLGCTAAVTRRRATHRSALVFPHVTAIEAPVGVQCDDRLNQSEIGR